MNTGVLRESSFSNFLRRPLLAWSLWGLLFLTVSILVWMRPDEHTVTKSYRHAAEQWRAGKNLYRLSDAHGFQYFPQAAILYIPFTLPPKAVGEVLWRWVSIGLFVSALWRLARAAAEGNESDSAAFLLVTLLVLPASLSSARDGQANMPLAALYIHAFLDMSRQRWSRAALSLCVGLILKPISLVPILLAGALRFRSDGLAPPYRHYRRGRAAISAA